MGNRMLARLAVTAAAGLLTLAAAAPALAADPVEIPLKDSHTGQTAESGSWPEKCAADEFNGVEVPEGSDGWHFVVPSAGGYKDVAFVSLTLTFDAGVVTIDDFDPSDGRWIRESNPRHAYLFTPAGWTLQSGVAETVDGDSEGEFNVSHACPGEPKEEDEPGNGGEQPGNGDDEEPGNEDEDGEPGDEDEAPGDEDEKALPVTGSAASRLVGAGALLLTAGAAMAGGVGLVAVRRRRRLSNLADD